MHTATRIGKILLQFCSTLLLTINVVFANVGCPDSARIKNVVLTKAEENPHQKGDWLLLSDVFVDRNLVWTVSYWTILLNATTPADALSRGKIYFRDSPIIIDKPTPAKIPHNKVICQYTPEGRLYVIDAVGSRQ